MAGGAQPIAASVRWGGGLALALVAVLTLGTIGALLSRAEPGRGLGPAEWAALRFTLVQALISAALSCVLAVPAARALARRRFPGRGVLVALLGAPFLLPAIVAVFGIVAIWGRAGLFSRGLEGLGVPGLDVYGLKGVVLAHVFFNVALVARLVLQGWLAIPAEQFRLAAQLGFAPGDVFRRIEAPMLRDVLPGAFVLVFLLCMTSFAVALTLGGGPRATTLELAIYQAVRFDFDLGRAAWLALIQFALCGGVTLAALRFSTRASFGGGVLGSVRRWDAGALRLRLLDAGVLVALALFLGLPLAAVAVRGIAGLAEGLPGAVWAAASRSLAVALGSAALALGLGLGFAGLVDARRARGGGRWVEAAGLMTLAASPFVIGTGLFILLYPLADPFALALPVTATVNAAMALPFVLRALLPALTEARTVDGRLADSLGIEGLARFRLVVWARLRQPMGFAAGLAAALSMGDLGIIALFAPPEMTTLPLLMQQLMAAYRTEAAGGVALVLVALTYLLFWVFDGEVGSMLVLEGIEIAQDDWRMTADLALGTGSSTALIGPSGSGKSTLLNAIAGFIAPARGRILWEGRDITGLPPAERPLTLLFQEHNLFAHLSAAANVGLGLRPDLRLDGAGWARVEAALAEVGLEGLGKRKPGQLSGGQRQRVALARALLRGRPLLLMDEPFAALGPALRAEMVELVTRIRDEHGTTLIVATHQPEDARRIAGLTVIVDGYRAFPPRPTEALFADPPPELRAYLG